MHELIWVYSKNDNILYSKSEGKRKYEGRIKEDGRKKKPYIFLTNNRLYNLESLTEKEAKEESLKIFHKELEEKLDRYIEALEDMEEKVKKHVRKIQDYNFELNEKYHKYAKPIVKLGDAIYCCEIISAVRGVEVTEYKVVSKHLNNEDIPIYVAKSKNAGFDFDQIDIALGRVFLNKKEAEENAERWRKENISE